ncbi:MAG: VOC family protein [Chloroflexi bacterium]|nr:VOC family protein [Chloroflexota bacterium]
MPVFSYDHIHLRSRDPLATAKFYERMFDATIIESVQDGQPRIDLDLNGLTIFIARVPADSNMPDKPVGQHLGLEHFGLRVDNLDETAAELKRRGATFATEPRQSRPGVKIAFIEAPENVQIEIIERS